MGSELEDNESNNSGKKRLTHLPLREVETQSFLDNGDFNNG